MLPHRTQKALADVSIPVLCKMWHEDGVWNAVAADLPVAAFGETYEEARENLASALVCHFEALLKSKRIEATIESLQKASRQYFSMEEIPINSSLLKMLVAMKNQEFMALA